MNILFDTNVILDVLLDREPFGEQAARLFTEVEESRINGVICADSVTTIFYLVQKGAGKQFARKQIKLLLDLFSIIPVNRSILEDALHLPFEDYEDAVIYQAAKASSIDGIVTRNRKDFAHAKIALYSPVELLTYLERN